MAVSDEFSAYIRELLEPLGGVSLRRMFGGVGIFRDGLMFGLIASEQLYFKVDEDNRARFEEEGCGPFTYEAKNGKRAVMSYHAAPDFLLDDPEEMIDWARSGIGAALRTDAKKAKTSSRRGKKKGGS